MNKPVVGVLYTCDKCGLKDKLVNVEERAPDEELTDWMYKVQLACSQDHDRVSPTCYIYKFTHVKIPMAHGSDFVGRAERH